MEKRAETGLTVTEKPIVVENSYALQAADYDRGSKRWRNMALAALAIGVASGITGHAELAIASTIISLVFALKSFYLQDRTTGLASIAQDHRNNLL